MLPYALTDLPVSELAVLQRLAARRDPDIDWALALFADAVQKWDVMRDELECSQNEGSLFTCIIDHIICSWITDDSDPKAVKFEMLHAGWSDPPNELSSDEVGVIQSLLAVRAEHVEVAERCRTMEEENAKLAEDCRRMRQARSRSPGGGRRPFGTGAGEPEQVQEILRLLAGGVSYSEVARRLNEAGWRTQSGKEWRAQQVKNVAARYAPGTGPVSPGCDSAATVEAAAAG